MGAVYACPVCVSSCPSARTCSAEPTDEAESSAWGVSQTWQVALVHLFVFMAYFSHIRCMTSNPGVLHGALDGNGAWSHIYIFCGHVYIGFVPKSRSKVDFSEGADKVKTEVGTLAHTN